MVRAFLVEHAPRNLVPRAPRNVSSKPTTVKSTDGLAIRAAPRPGEPVAGHSIERHSVYWLEQLPVKKARYATRAERGYLVKGTLTSAVPQPGITGEPSDAP
jgi:hypothetical protein